MARGKKIADGHKEMETIDLENYLFDVLVTDGCNQILGGKRKGDDNQLKKNCFKKQKNAVDREDSPKWLPLHNEDFGVELSRLWRVLDSSLSEGDNASPLPKYDLFK